MKRPERRYEPHSDWVARLRALAAKEGAETAETHKQFTMLVDPRIVPDEDSQAGQPS